MIPRYQDTNLDDTNRAKKRVSKNLQRSYTSPQTSTDDGSNQSALKFSKLVELLNTCISLLDESLGYTEDTPVVENYYNNAYSLVPKLNNTLSKLIQTYKQIEILVKSFVVDFNYITSDESTSLRQMVIENFQKIYDLRRAIQNISNILPQIDLRNINRLTDSVNSEFLKVIGVLNRLIKNHNQRQDNYIAKPAEGEIGVRGLGGYRILDYSKRVL